MLAADGRSQCAHVGREASQTDPPSWGQEAKGLLRLNLPRRLFSFSRTPFGTPRPGSCRPPVRSRRNAHCGRNVEEPIHESRDRVMPTVLPGIDGAESDADLARQLLLGDIAGGTDAPDKGGNI